MSRHKMNLIFTFILLMISPFALSKEANKNIGFNYDNKNWKLIENNPLLGGITVLINTQNEKLRGFVHQEAGGFVENNTLETKTEKECSALKKYYTDKGNSVSTKIENLGPNQVCQIELLDGKNKKSQLLFFSIKEYKTKKVFVANTITFNYLRSDEKKYISQVNKLKMGLFGSQKSSL